MQPKTKTEGTTPDQHVPRKMTFAENVALTIKVLAIAGLILAALWGANHWTSPK